MASCTRRTWGQRRRPSRPRCARSIRTRRGRRPTPPTDGDDPGDPCRGDPRGRGAGPVFLYPSASDDALGSEKWGAGPTAVLLRQDTGWTYGILANHVWSFAGNDERQDISSTFMQPFLSYTTKSYTTFGVNTES